jgi:L-lactate dehydrogenase complex protein LldG
MKPDQNPIIESIRRSLGRSPDAPIPPRPPVLPPRPAGAPDEEIDLLLAEINKLSGVALRLDEAGLDQALQDLVTGQEIQRAALWPTAGLKRLRIAGRLAACGVEIVPPDADKYALAACDLGVTEVDFALPETGTLALLSSAEKPRAISLVPRLHLAILSPAALRADLHQVFAEAKGQDYLVFITGPSRTSDIELTTTLGVHGPKGLYVWVL